MTYRVIIPASTERQLDKLEPDIRRRIQRRIVSLEQNPRPHDVIKLKGLDAYRIREGNYRVIYTIEDTIRIVTVIKVDHRRDVYRPQSKI